MSKTFRYWTVAVFWGLAGGCGMPKMEPVAPPGMEYHAVAPEKDEDKAEALGETVGMARPNEVSLPPAPPPAEPTKVGERKTLEGGLTYETLKEGTGSRAEWGKTLVVHYTGTLPGGQKFDSSRDRGRPFPVKLGYGEVIKGWEMGLQGMRVGEQRRLTIPSDLGYGERGQPPRIPPNSPLIFEVELVDVK